MSATAIREKRETTIPEDVSNAAALKPGDHVDWRYENGEIRGRKVATVAPRTIIAKLVMLHGHLVADTTNLTVDYADIEKAVEEERQAQAGRPARSNRPKR